MPLTVVPPLKITGSQVSRFASGDGIGLAYGGTGVDLSATGGASKFLCQASAGATFTVVQPTLADLGAGILGVDLTLGAVGIKFAGAGTASGGTTQIFSTGANQHLIYNTPSGYSHSLRTANVDMLILGYSPLTSYADNAFGLGQFGCGGGNAYAGIYSNGTQYLVSNCTLSHQWKVGGTSYALLNSTGLEANRLCLGQTIGTPIDPGAGGLMLSGLIRFYSGYGASVSDGTLVQIYTDGSSLLHNVGSGAYHGLRVAGYNAYTFGYSPTLASAGTNTFQLGDGSGAYLLSDGFSLVANIANTYTFQFKYAGSVALSINDKCTSTGSIICGASGANATTATGPFIYSSSCAGAPTGTPTAVTGHIPFTFDATNNKLYAYLNSAWKSVTLT